MDANQERLAPNAKPRGWPTNGCEVTWVLKIEGNKVSQVKEECAWVSWLTHTRDTCPLAKVSSGINVDK
jgi:hypothetical protein